MNELPLVQRRQDAQRVPVHMRAERDQAEGDDRVGGDRREQQQDVRAVVQVTTISAFAAAAPAEAAISRANEAPRPISAPTGRFCV